MKKPTGYVLYQGPSLLTGDPVVVIAIFGSENEKTGDMVQTYILVDNGISPLDNVRSLEDVAVCGMCPHRHGLRGACYVRMDRGPAQVWKAYRKGNYPFDPEAARQRARGRKIRLGSYGDPAAVPVLVWQDLLTNAAGHTGYTHQWMDDASYELMKLVMASVDTVEERDAAKAKGYRTFRIRTEVQALGTGEFVCPASSEADHRLTCNQCLACSGGVDTKKADPVIVVHGWRQRRFGQGKLF